MTQQNAEERPGIAAAIVVHEGRVLMVRRRVSEELAGCTMRAGMSCYPAYAFDATQLVDQSLAALDAAREWRQDRIEVTTASPED